MNPATTLGAARASKLNMAKNSKKAWMAEVARTSAAAAFRQAYQHVQIDQKKYLQRVKRLYRLPIRSWDDMQGIDERVLNPIADRAISTAKRAAALEGVGLGMGGMLTILPDMGVLSAITIRMLQKLSLIYGFEYSKDREVAALWVAAASAAGLDLGRDFLEKQAIERVVPRVIDLIAVKVGAEVAEKWTGRIVPILSAGVAGTLNYYFVRAWGQRAQTHFLERHRALGAPALRVARPRIASTRQFPVIETL
jgi:uncharacterized protein (DUF697 family)